MIMFSEPYSDPYTGAHSNTIEGVWSQVKRKLKAINGMAKGKLLGYLDEFNWQRNYPGDHFEHMLVQIAEMYPVN